MKKILLIYLMILLSFVGCTDKDDKIISGELLIDGHPAIDLGLPSGLKWAVNNVAYGKYYAWGEKSVNTTYNSDYCSTYEVYMNDISADPDYDVATKKMGDSWRTPTRAEFMELIENCIFEWDDDNDGCYLTGPSGYSIYLNAGGYKYGDSEYTSDENCLYYWTSTPDYETNKYSYRFMMKNNYQYELGLKERYFGMKIRAVSYGDGIAHQYEVITEKETMTVNGVSFDMIKVHGGTFRMGAQNDDKTAANYDIDASYYERPVHSVTLDDYYIGETEVTQELWTAVMGNNPSNENSNLKPVNKVSWNDCQTFISKLNALTGKNFRLPTEAEWEYAARGGNRTLSCKYSGNNLLDNVAWHYGNSSDNLHNVKTKLPNELGIYDMSGNVSEWCYDYFDYDYYSISPQDNPQGPTSGNYHVERGGGYKSYNGECRVSNRSYSSYSYSDIGFRLAL